MVKIRNLGLIAVVRGASADDAVEVSEVLIEGGVLGIEVAFTTPRADLVLKRLSNRFGAGIALGAGTVTTLDQARLAAEAGAEYLVSPGCDPELLPTLLEIGPPTIPGVLTPSEIMIARRLGATALKLFPGSLGGPAHLQALSGPFPDVPFIPTGGVSLENVGDWFAAGAMAVGVGGALAPPQLKDQEDRKDLRVRAEQFVASVASSKGASIHSE